jgi:amino acid adenylation domain-containing protein
MNVPADQLTAPRDARRTAQDDQTTQDQGASDQTAVGRTAKSNGHAVPSAVAERDESAVADDPLIASIGQEAIWLNQRMNPTACPYNLVCSVVLRGDVDVAALGRAVKKVWNRRPILRTTFVHERGAVRHRPYTGDLRVRIEDASRWDEKTRKARWDALSDEPFDLEAGPLVRATILVNEGVEEYALHLALHHIIADLWSMTLVMNELLSLYGAERSGMDDPPPVKFDDYSQFALGQRRYFAGPEGRRAAEYWKRQLADAPAPIAWPNDRPYPATPSYRGTTYWCDLDTETVVRLRTLAKREGATLYVACLAAFNELLHRLTGSRDIIVGSPTLGRNEMRWAKALGNFTNPIALRTRFEGISTFRQLLHSVRDTVRDGKSHAAYPFPAVIDDVSFPREPGRPPLVQAVLAWERVQSLDELEVRSHAESGTRVVLEKYGIEGWIQIDQRGAPFELTLQIQETVDDLRLRWQYASDVFDEATIARLWGNFRKIIEGVVAEPDRPLAELSIVGDGEAEQLHAWGRGAERPYDLDVCLHDIIARQAAASPDAPAVSFGEQALTYGELERRAADLAARLRAEGIKRDSIVGVFMSRSPELVTALYGVLKAGGAYMPLSPDDPIDRVEYQLADARSAVVLTRRDDLSKLEAANLPAGEVRVIVVDELAVTPGLVAAKPDQAVSPGLVAAKPDEAAARATPDSLAYVIYTSGSTGRPKGVMIEHRSIVNRLRWMQEEYGLTPDDRVLQKTPSTFDVSVWEFFWPLMVGAELVVAEPGGHRDAGYLARIINERKITTLHFVPTMLRAFLDLPGLSTLGSLRRVFCSGEALTTDLVDRFHASQVSELHNLYGPTEAAVDITYQPCPRDERREPVPIGRPIANSRTYVLDEQRRLQPIGAPGELYLGGVGLARGYVNRPDLTNERFVTVSLAGSTDVADVRLYRTGDLARWTPDGRIEYLGRADDQVKLRGNRIELGEVEAAIGTLPGVSVAAADVKQDASGGKRLVAYVVPLPGAKVRSIDVRKALAAKLPAYMVPTVVTTLDALPLTSSGKIDRKKLPTPARSRDDLDAAFVEPRTPEERFLAGLFTEVLQLDRIGMNDNFFDLGGASNQAVEVIRRASDAGYALTPDMVFRHPTVGELAAACLLPQPTTAAAVVEGLGVYLPPKCLTSDEVIRGMANPVTFKLEQFTGIRSRRVAGEEEFAYDLAVKAVEECFRNAKAKPTDVDALICCNISRNDAPDDKITYEPSTAARLCAQFGIRDALAFDLSNACAGMFTGISVAEGLLKGGIVRRVLVVSGEYISYLTQVAQRTIDSDFDSRLPCLTLGDAGAAVLLGGARNGDDAGFEEIDLCTLSQYSELCVAKVTPTGPMMFTDMLGVSSVITRQGIDHWLETAKRKNWSLAEVEHIIPHQVSDTTVVNGFNEVRKRSDVEIPRDAVISNVAERGNTATTSHWVAVWDHIRSGRINSGDRVLFGVSGSGITIGTALYRFDDLPDRMRAKARAAAKAAVNGAALNGAATNGTATNGAATNGAATNGVAHAAPASGERQRPARRRLDPRLRRVAITGVGTALPGAGKAATCMAMSQRATRTALNQAGVIGSDVNLLIYTGIYRDDFLSEPAFATMLADKLRLHDPDESDRPPFFGFDLLNGSVGFLEACCVAAQRIQTGRIETAVVATAEVENHPDEVRIGLTPSAGTVVLAPSEDGRAGFEEFVFVNAWEHLDKRFTSSRGCYTKGYGWIVTETQPECLAAYAAALVDGMQQLRQRERLAWSDVAVVLLPQISPEFTRLMCDLVPEICDKLVTDVGPQGDLFTASVPWTLEAARKSGRARPGDLAMIGAVGAGVQAAAATYRF